LAAIVLLVLVSVGVHYEALRFASALEVRQALPQRVRVAAGVLVAFVAHSFEALLFAIGWVFLIRVGVAELSVPAPDFVDVLYFSFSTYTSLGYGDIVPVGDARLLAGIESLLGLVLIAWTASFTYLEMREHWIGYRDRAEPFDRDSA
jgi:hypothetical protein